MKYLVALIFILLSPIVVDYYFLDTEFKSLFQNVLINRESWANTYLVIVGGLLLTNLYPIVSKIEQSLETTGKDILKIRKIESKLKNKLSPQERSHLAKVVALFMLFLFYCFWTTLLLNHHKLALSHYLDYLFIPLTLVSFSFILVLLFYPLQHVWKIAKKLKENKIKHHPFKTSKKRRQQGIRKY